MKLSIPYFFCLEAICQCCQWQLDGEQSGNLILFSNAAASWKHWKTYISQSMNLAAAPRWHWCYIYVCTVVFSGWWKIHPKVWPLPKFPTIWKHYRIYRNYIDLSAYWVVWPSSSPRSIASQTQLANPYIHWYVWCSYMETSPVGVITSRCWGFGQDHNIHLMNLNQTCTCTVLDIKFKYSACMHMQDIGSIQICEIGVNCGLLEKWPKMFQGCWPKAEKHPSISSSLWSQSLLVANNPFCIKLPYASLINHQFIIYTASQVCQLYANLEAPSWPDYVDYTPDPWDDAKSLGQVYIYYIYTTYIR